MKNLGKVGGEKVGVIWSKYIVCMPETPNILKMDFEGGKLRNTNLQQDLSVYQSAY